MKKKEIEDKTMNESMLYGNFEGNQKNIDSTKIMNGSKGQINFSFGFNNFLNFLYIYLKKKYII